MKKFVLIFVLFIALTPAAWADYRPPQDESTTHQGKTGGSSR